MGKGEKHKGSSKIKAFAARLRDYLIEYCGAEDLDRLSPRPSQKIADFTFDSRAVVLELKSISEVGPGKNPKTYPGLSEAHTRHGLDPLTGYPNFSKWSDDELAVYKRFFLDDTTFVKKMFDKAEAQIASTKALLQIETSKGVLFILNTCPHVSPLDLHYRTFNLINRLENGSIKYEHIETVMCYSIDPVTADTTATFAERPRFLKERSFARNLLDCLEKPRGENRTGIVEGFLPMNIPWSGERARLLADL